MSEVLSDREIRQIRSVIADWLVPEECSAQEADDGRELSNKIAHNLSPVILRMVKAQVDGGDSR